MSDFPSPTQFYKVLGDNLYPHHGGLGKWTVGKKRSVRDELAPCHIGLHAVTIDQLPRWLGPQIHPVLEVSEERVDGGDKWVFRSLTIGPAYDTWNERSARHFAADCAAHALREVKARHGWLDKRCNAAVSAARKFADGRIDDAARSAAWSAALSAAGSAAESAAWSAAWSAALSAAESAAYAARSAAGNWQAKRLARYLAGELPK